LSRPAPTHRDPQPEACQAREVLSSQSCSSHRATVTEWDYSRENGSENVHRPSRREVAVGRATAMPVGTQGDPSSESQALAFRITQSGRRGTGRRRTRKPALGAHRPTALHRHNIGSRDARLRGLQQFAIRPLPDSRTRVRLAMLGTVPLPRWYLRMSQVVERPAS
jgi:hypothetical protein